MKNLKAIKNPSPQVLKLMGASVIFVLGARKLPKWNEIQQAILNPKKFLDKLAKVKQSMDNGQDFSAQLKCARNTLREPDITLKKARDASMTLVHILEWLNKIVEYGEGKRAGPGGQVDWTQPLESGLNAVTAASITELKSLANPPRSAMPVVSAVNRLLGYQPEWKYCQKAMANKHQYCMELASVKDRMDKGEDFSKGLREAKSLVDNPDVDAHSVHESSKAAYGLYQWLQFIIPYGLQK